MWIWAIKLAEWRRYRRKLSQNRNPFKFFSWRMLKDFCVWQGGWLRAGVTPQISFCRIQGLMDSFCKGSDVLDFEFPWRPFSTGQCFATQEAWEWWPEGRGSWGDWRFCCQSGLLWWSVGFWEPWRLSDILRIAPKTKSIFSLIIDERPIDFGWACVFQGLPVADGVTYDLIASHITISW